MTVIRDLFDLLARGRLAIFLGGDLPRTASGLPGRAELAAALARRLGLDGPSPPWPDIATRYEATAGRNALISWLRDRLEEGDPPGTVHGLLARLPASTYVTTTYDTCLYEALRAAGRRPNLPLVDAASLGFLDREQPTVVKLFGLHDRPASLVLTAADLRQLPQTKAQVLAGVVHPTLANQGVLILGQDLRDAHFQTLYQHALFQAGALRPRAYAAWPGLEEWEVQTWAGLEVTVLDRTALELLGELAGESVDDFVSDPGLPLEEEREETPPTLPPEAPPADLRPAPSDPSLAAVRELLVTAFTAAALRRFVLYTENAQLQPLRTRLGANDDLETMVERVLDYCSRHHLLPDLLHEVQQANPGAYAEFQTRLHGQEGTSLPAKG